MNGQVLDRLCFVALPYVSLMAFALMAIYRYRTRTMISSNRASELLKNKERSRAVVPLRYTILAVAVGHLLALLVPRGILWWNGHLLRLYILEVSALAFGLLTLASMIGLVTERRRSSNVRVVTSAIDGILYAMLLLQVFIGVCVAVFYPWGSAWFASILSPYVWSIVRLSPDISDVAAMPLLVRTHIVLAFIIFGLLPLSRLIQTVVIPHSCLHGIPRMFRRFGRRRRQTNTAS